MTSVKVKINNSITKQLGPYCFKIQDKLHYLIGVLLLYDNHNSVYAQIYILDIAE